MNERKQITRFELMALFDNHGRALNYLRLAVTDRCNLRCFYCMPEEGLNFQRKEQLLTYEEMTRLVSILAALGISKVRITGGEPFVRKDLLPFMAKLKQIKGIEAVAITTNGTAQESVIDEMRTLGINGVNLSLDCLDRSRFHRITRRDEFDKVWSFYQKLISSGLKTKINTVVMADHNLEDIIPMCALTKNDPVSVRFIEEMPFNGGSKGYQSITWDAGRILRYIGETYGPLDKVPEPASSTAHSYRIAGAPGTIGVIPAYTRTICGQCDRIRLTPQGELKTCLYDGGVFSFRDFLRQGASDKEIADKFRSLFSKRPKDGFEAERHKVQNSGSFESMATIGG